MESRRRMTGIWLEEGSARVRSDLPIPAGASGPEADVRIRVLRAGICGTDLAMLRGYHPFRGVLGHEFVGVVETGPPEWLGRRVVAEINVACGECGECRAGRSGHCVHREVIGIRGRDGAFAEYVAVPVRNLHAVPDGVDADTAVFAEPLAAALEILEQVRIGPDDRVLVVGDGRLGILAAHVLALTGCRVRTVGRHADKLALLAARGIETAVWEGGEEPAGEGRTRDVVVECTGSPDGFAVARRAVRPRGTIVLKSTYPGHLTLDASSLVVDEITVVGSRCGPLPRALELLETGEVEVKPMIHARYPLDRGEEALRRAAEPGILKVLLDVGEEWAVSTAPSDGAAS